MATKSPVRDRILDAAVGLLRDSGVKRLAQPQVAKAANVPQGHLTYYFPKKADILMAVADRFMAMVSAEMPSNIPHSALLISIARRLVLDRTRTRMLLGLLVEADGEVDLRAAMVRGANLVRGGLASALDLPHDSREAHLALALFWGLGVQQFLLGDERPPEETEALIVRAIELLGHLKDDQAPASGPAATG